MPQWQHEPDVLEQCRTAVERLLARYEWRLVGSAELTEQAHSYVRQGVVPNAHSAAMYAYCEILYHACSGLEGMHRREQGYREVSRFLNAVAEKRYPGVSDDAAQRALIHILESFERIQQPGAFLAFALQHLRDAAKSMWNEASRQPDSLDEVSRPHTITPGERVQDQKDADPEAQMLRLELQDRLAQCVVSFVQRHPRAAEQMAAVWLKYIDGLDDRTIALKLNKPVKSVYEMRSRALKTLQREPEWRTLAGDLDLVADE